MAFQPHKDNSKSGYKISIKSENGNTIAFVNLTEAFLKAVTGKTKKTVTVDDIQSINNGHFMTYLMKQTFMLEEVTPTEIVEAKDF